MNMRAMRCCLILPFVSLLILSACVKRPDGVLSERKMVQIVADLELAEAYLQSNPQRSDADRAAMVQYVVDKHGVSRAQFDSTMSWYGRNMDQYYELFAKVDRELSSRRRKAEGSSSVEHTTSDLWPYSRMALISPLSPSNSMEFSIPTADVEKGQRIELNMRFRSAAGGSSLLGVEYEDGSVSFLNRALTSGRRIQMKIQTDSAKLVKRVFGNILLSSDRDLPLWIDSIYMRALPFDSMEYYNIHSQRSYNVDKR